MKRFIFGFIRLISNFIIFLILIAIFILAFLFIFSKVTNISTEDTISYAQSFTQEITSLNFTDKTLVDFNSSDSPSNSSTEDIIISKTSKTNNYFYYEQLSDEGKIIYSALENNIDNLKKDKFNIDFSTKFNTLLNQSDGQYNLNKAFQSALDAFFYDHPELFYINLEKISLIIEYISFGPKKTYSVSIKPKDGYNYLADGFNSEEDVNKAISKTENIVNNLINKLPNTSDYTKALEVHDILVNSLEYDSTSKNYAHNMYGALVEHKVVCEGYAKSFKYIMDSLNIDCILVSGNATNSSNKTEAHMWNYIKLNNKWYGVDVTWDDPIIIGGTSKVIKHDYFCKGSNVFNEKHSAHNKISDKGQTFKLPTLSNKNYK